MKDSSLNIAIFTPSKNPYSETFIQAHKKYLHGQVFYYYGGKGRIKLEGHEKLTSNFNSFINRIKRKLKGLPFSWLNEQLLLASFKKYKINVILIEYGTHAYKLLPILKTSKLPFVVHFHGYDASITNTIERCNNYLDIFQIASKVIVVSKVMEMKLLKLGCPKEKLVYNVYGPQPEFEKIVPQFGEKQFISIGRFTDKKAPYYTIMAFKQLVKTHPDVKLLMAGDGELLNMCENLVKQYGLESKVEFLGVITADRYCELLRESLAFVQHSITAKSGDMEGTPVSVLEASVAGLPIIATYHAGIPDVVIHNETGLLCKEHDVNAMTTNMLTILKNKEFAKEMGAAGKKNILNNFSLPRHINVLQKVLEDSVKNN